MSQHTFFATHQGRPVKVVMGWDRPLAYFFMTVMLLEGCVARSDEDEDDDVLYSNLDQSRPFGLDLDDLRGALDELGITVPESMFDEVESDAIHNVGNRFMTHQADGTFAAT